MSVDMGKVGWLIELVGVDKVKSSLDGLSTKLNQTGQAGSGALRKIETAESDYRTQNNQTRQSIDKTTFSFKNMALGMTAIGASSVHIITSLNDIDKANLRVRTTQKQVEESTQRLARLQKDASASAQDLADAHRDVSIAQERHRLAQDQLNDRIINTATSITSTLVTSIFVAQNAFKGLSLSMFQTKSEALLLRTGLIQTSGSAVGTASAIGGIVPASQAATLSMHGLWAASMKFIASPIGIALMAIAAAFLVWESNVGNLRGSIEKLTGTNLSAIGAMNTMTEKIFSGKSAAEMATDTVDDFGVSLSNAQGNASSFSNTLDPTLSGSFNSVGSASNSATEAIQMWSTKMVQVQDDTGTFITVLQKVPMALSESSSQIIKMAKEFDQMTLKGLNQNTMKADLDFLKTSVLNDLRVLKENFDQGKMGVEDYTASVAKLKSKIVDVANIFGTQGKHSALEFLHAVEDTGVYGAKAIKDIGKEVDILGSKFGEGTKKAKELGNSLDEIKKKRVILDGRTGELRLEDRIEDAHHKLKRLADEYDELLKNRLESGFLGSSGIFSNITGALSRFSSGINGGIAALNDKFMELQKTFKDDALGWLNAQKNLLIQLNSQGNISGYAPIVALQRAFGSQILSDLGIFGQRNMTAEMSNMLQMPMGSNNIALGGQVGLFGNVLGNQFGEITGEAMNNLLKNLPVQTIDVNSTRATGNMAGVAAKGAHGMVSAPSGLTAAKGTGRRSGGHSMYRMDTQGGRERAFKAFELPKIIDAAVAKYGLDYDTVEKFANQSFFKEFRSNVGEHGVTVTSFDYTKFNAMVKAEAERVRIERLKAQRDAAILELQQAAFQQSFGLVTGAASTALGNMSMEDILYYMSTDRGKQDLNNMLIFQNKDTIDLSVSNDFNNMNLDTFPPELRKRYEELIALLNSEAVKAIGTA